MSGSNIKLSVVKLIVYLESGLHYWQYSKPVYINNLTDHHIIDKVLQLANKVLDPLCYLYDHDNMTSKGLSDSVTWIKRPCQRSEANRLYLPTI